MAASMRQSRLAGAIHYHRFTATSILRTQQDAPLVSSSSHRAPEDHSTVHRHLDHGSTVPRVGREQRLTRRNLTDNHDTARVALLADLECRASSRVTVRKTYSSASNWTGGHAVDQRETQHAPVAHVDLFPTVLSHDLDRTRCAK